MTKIGRNIFVMSYCDRLWHDTCDFSDSDSDSWVMYEISWKCHLANKCGISDESARKSRKCKILSNLAFWTYNAKVAPFILDFFSYLKKTYYEIISVVVHTYKCKIFLLAICDLFTELANLADLVYNLRCPCDVPLLKLFLG